MDRRTRLDEDVGRLFDYLVEYGRITYLDALDEWSWSRRYFLAVVRVFRRIFANDPSALVCNRDPDDRRGPWVYCISADIREWAAARVKQIESQLTTMRDVSSSATKVLDGRTLLGKYARAMNKSFVRLLEDLEELREQQAM